MSRQWRKNVVFWLAFLVGMATVSPAGAQSLERRLKRHVTFLASADLDGRGNGSEGLDKARDYLVDQFERIGLQPAGEDGYLSKISAVTGVEPSRNTFLQIGDSVLAQKVEFSPASFSDGGSFEAPAVFVGYGLSAPSVGYDDYAGVDVRGKVVIALSGAPPAYSDTLASGKVDYLLSSGSKAAVALAMGARALLLVNDPHSHGNLPEQAADQLPKLRPAPALDGVAAGYLTERAAARVLATAGVDLAALQDEIDRSRKPHSRLLDLEVEGNLSLDRTTSPLYNVQAKLAGTAGAPSEPIVLTAHYDGLGFGQAGSLSEESDRLHPGADDNASGVAVLIEVARSLAKDPPASHPPIIFAAPAGEELALRGSRRLAQTLLDSYGGGTIVNFDMLGRLRERRARVAYAGDDEAGRKLLDRLAAEHGLSLQPEELASRFSDHVSFVEVGFRGVNITTGRHGDYHMPDDTLDKLNWKGLVRMNGFVEGVIRGLAGQLE